jgi:PAS domain S-box-containing protein
MRYEQNGMLGEASLSRPLSTSPDGHENSKPLQAAFVVLIGAALLAAVVMHSLIGRERTLALIAAATVLGGGLWLARRGHPTTASAVLLGSLLGVTTFLTVNGGGVRDIAFLLYPIVVMTAALLLQGRAFIAIALLTIAIATSIPLAETLGWYQALKDPEITWVEVIAVILIIGIATLAGTILSHNLHRTLERLSQQREELLRHRQELLARSAELVESESRWRCLVENLPGAILTIRPTGIVERADGRQRNAFDEAGRPVVSFFEPVTAGDVMLTFERCLERRAPSSCRALRLGADGQRWYELHFSPLVRDGTLQSVTAIVIDISERIRAEEAVKELNVKLEARVQDRTRALTAANEELEAFAYSVSHDLRAPLRHVLGYLAMLRDETGARLGDGPHRYIETIERSARRMAALIDDLLSLSRVNRSQVQRQPVDLVTLTRSVIDELEPETLGRKVEWTVGDLPTVTADEGLMRQVIVNLLGNALKFTRRCEVARIRVGPGPSKEGWCTIEVEDNGAGFDMQYASKLFGLFQRLHTGEEFEGTGIGLAIVRRILERHGGDISAHSIVNGGATFTLSLPLDPAGSPSTTADLFTTG